MSMSRRLFNFFRRPWGDQWLFLQAYAGLGLARLAIQTIPFAKLAPFLGKHMTESIGEIPVDKMDQTFHPLHSMPAVWLGRYDVPPPSLHGPATACLRPSPPSICCAGVALTPLSTWVRLWTMPGRLRHMRGCAAGPDM